MPRWVPKGAGVFIDCTCFFSHGPSNFALLAGLAGLAGEGRRDYGRIIIIIITLLLVIIINIMFIIVLQQFHGPASLWENTTLHYTALQQMHKVQGRRDYGRIPIALYAVAVVQCSAM